jgi:hypothetical protein
MTDFPRHGNNPSKRRRYDNSAADESTTGRGTGCIGTQAIPLASITTFQGGGRQAAPFDQQDWLPSVGVGFNSSDPLLFNHSNQGQSTVSLDQRHIARDITTLEHSLAHSVHHIQGNSSYQGEHGEFLVAGFEAPRNAPSTLVHILPNAGPDS